MWTENFQIFKLDLEKAVEPEIKLSTVVESSKKPKSSRKTSSSALLTMPKPLTVWITRNCGKFFKRWDYHLLRTLTCLLRNLYAGQEATVRTGHGTTDGSRLVKEYTKAVYRHPACLTYMQQSAWFWNAWLDETQAGIKIAGRNISNLRYADNTTLVAESEELKSLLMKVKEDSEKASLKLNIQKTKIMACGPITSWQIDEETVETVTVYFLGLQNHWRWQLQPWN